MKTYGLKQYLWLFVKQRLRNVTLREAIIAMTVLILLYLFLSVIEMVLANIIYLLLLYPFLKITLGLFAYLRKCLTKLRR